MSASLTCAHANVMLSLSVPGHGMLLLINREILPPGVLTDAGRHDTLVVLAGTGRRPLDWPAPSGDFVQR